MNNIEIYIGTDQIDFNDQINVKLQLNDYRDMDIGSSVTSYTIDIPLTDNNYKILKNISDIRSKEQITDKATIVMSGITILKGKVRIIGSIKPITRIIIQGKYWMDALEGVSIQEIWEGGSTHEFNTTNIENSWSASVGAVYRYPLINFGQIYSEGFLPGSDVYPYDFYPMWQIENILERMFNYAGVTKANGFFTGTDGAKYHILSQPKPAKEDFIVKKGLSVYVDDNSDNYDVVYVVPDGIASEVTVQQVLDFDAETTDEGGDFSTSTNRYVAPEDGTYRFQTQISVYSKANILGTWTVNQNDITFLLRKNGSSIENIITSATDLYDIGNKVYNLDSGYIYLEAGDYIDIYVILFVNATNNTGGADSLILYVETGATTSYLKAVWDERNLWPGIGQTIDPSIYLPDINCIDFLKQLKKDFNLRFWYDQLNNTIYINTSNDFYGTTVIDWSDKLDYSESPDMQLLAFNYKQTQRFRYKPDDNDKAYSAEVSENGIPFEKTVEIETEYAQPGINEITNELYAPTVLGNMLQIGHTSGKIPRIYGNSDYIEIRQFPEYRAKQWEPRILKWEGLVALTSGNYDYYQDYEDSSASNKTSFPSAETPDYEDLYNDYHIQDFFRIKNNRLVIAILRLDAHELPPFTGVVGVAANEGFRATYKISIDEVDMYFIIASLVTDGDRVRAELVQKT